MHMNRIHHSLLFLLFRPLLLETHFNQWSRQVSCRWQSSLFQLGKYESSIDRYFKGSCNDPLV